MGGWCRRIAEFKASRGYMGHYPKTQKSGLYSFPRYMFFGKTQFLAFTSLLASCSILLIHNPQFLEDPQWPTTWISAKEARFRAVAPLWPAGESLPLVCRNGIPSLVTPMSSYRVICLSTLSSALFMIAKKQNQPRCPSTDRRITKL